MSWIKGFDFRATSGYVSDPSNCTYVLDTNTYPVTRNGCTFGWNNTNPAARDRSTVPDPRFAGVNYVAGGKTSTFRVDLGNTGSTDVRFALGDYGAQQTKEGAVLKDNSTTVVTISEQVTNADQFVDPANNKYSSANWPGSNTPNTYTYTTTIVNLTFSPSSGGANDAIAHLHITGQDPPAGLPDDGRGMLRGMWRGIERGMGASSW